MLTKSGIREIKCVAKTTKRNREGFHPLPGRDLQRVLALHTPGQSFYQMPSVAALRPAERAAREYGRLFERFAAATVSAVVVDRDPGPSNGRRKPTVAGELVAAVELGYINGNHQPRDGSGPDARNRLQVPEVGIALERLRYRGCIRLGHGVTLSTRPAVPFTASRQPHYLAVAHPEPGRFLSAGIATADPRWQHPRAFAKGRAIRGSRPAALRAMSIIR